MIWWDGRGRCGCTPTGVCGGQPGQLCLLAQPKETEVGEIRPKVSSPADGIHHVGTCCRGMLNLQSTQKNGGESPCDRVSISVKGEALVLGSHGNSFS